MPKQSKRSYPVSGYSIQPLQMASDSWRDLIQSLSPSDLIYGDASQPPIQGPRRRRPVSIPDTVKQQLHQWPLVLSHAITIGQETSTYRPF
jgi:hypothetical protein